MKNENHLKEQLHYSGVKEGEPEAKMIETIFEVLNREPDFKLSPLFADKVVQRLVEQQQKSASRDNLYFALGISLIIVSGIVGALFTDFKPTIGVFKFLSGYSGLVIFAVILVMIIQWIDRKFIKKDFPSTTHS